MSCGRAPEKRFELKGKVVSVDKTQRQVTIAHERIPGFMDAMTMPFNIREDWALAALAPGQAVEATLVVQGDRSWIEGIRISQGEDSGGRLKPRPRCPGLERKSPISSFMNQDNKPIRLAQYRGHPLLLTFIYTRCPLPDFCPRTSRNFSEVYRGLKSIAKSGQKPHLLTVSFDTEYDTPAVLREYARRYMNPPDFGTWEFATGSPEDIKKDHGLLRADLSQGIGPDRALAGDRSDRARRQTQANLSRGIEWTPSQVWRISVATRG